MYSAVPTVREESCTEAAQVVVAVAMSVDECHDRSDSGDEDGSALDDTDLVAALQSMEPNPVVVATAAAQSCAAEAAVVVPSETAVAPFCTAADEVAVASETTAAPSCADAAAVAAPDLQSVESDLVVDAAGTTAAQSGTEETEVVVASATTAAPSSADAVAVVAPALQRVASDLLVDAPDTTAAQSGTEETEVAVAAEATAAPSSSLSQFGTDAANVLAPALLEDPAPISPMSLAGLFVQDMEEPQLTLTQLLEDGIDDLANTATAKVANEMLHEEPDLAIPGNKDLIVGSSRLHYWLYSWYSWFWRSFGGVLAEFLIINGRKVDFVRYIRIFLGGVLAEFWRSFGGVFGNQE